MSAVNSAGEGEYSTWYLPNCKEEPQSTYEALLYLPMYSNTSCMNQVCTSKSSRVDSVMIHLI